MTITPVTRQRVVAGAASLRALERSVDWPPEHAKLWKALVPRSGKAKSVQGELIRLTGRLTDEAFRNGNINWRDATAKAWKFVGNTLDDPSVFSAAERAEIKRQIRWILRHITLVPVEPLGSAYYILANRSVQWCRQHDKPIPLPPSDAYDF